MNDRPSIQFTTLVPSYHFPTKYPEQEYKYALTWYKEALTAFTWQLKSRIIYEKSNKAVILTRQKLAEFVSMMISSRQAKSLNIVFDEYVFMNSSTLIIDVPKIANHLAVAWASSLER